jgi:DNA-binding response OmpR family regulator
MIEDDDLLCRILRLNLARHGYTVAEADSVATALEAVRVASAMGTPFDLLLLDINLPDQTGWDLLRELRDGGPAAPSVRRSAPTWSAPPRDDGIPGGRHLPPVIVITAVRPAQCRMDEFQPAGVLVKPFPIDALLRLIARVLRAPVESQRAVAASGEDEDLSVR